MCWDSVGIESTPVTVPAAGFSLGVFFEASIPVLSLEK